MDHGGGFHREANLLSARPDPAKQHPERTIGSDRPCLPPFSHKDRVLLPERKLFQNQIPDVIRASLKMGEHPEKNKTKKPDHDSSMPATPPWWNARESQSSN